MSEIDNKRNPTSLRTKEKVYLIPLHFPYSLIHTHIYTQIQTGSKGERKAWRVSHSEPILPSSRRGTAASCLASQAPEMDSLTDPQETSPGENPHFPGLGTRAQAQKMQQKAQQEEHFFLWQSQFSRSTSSATTSSI